MGRYRLEHKVVLITGAARGIGKDTASRLIERGALVALIDREETLVRQVAAELGPRAEPFVADVTDHEAVTAAVDAAAAHFGGLDVVIANAGVMSVPGSVGQASADDFRRVLDINVLGTFNTVQAALPHVVSRRGYVLCVSSIAGLIPVPLLAPYVASKHAVDGFARTLRMELSSTGTKVGIAYFGTIDTDMARETIESAAAARVWASVPPPMGNSVPVGRAGEAIVNGISRRSSWVYAPSWMSGLLLSSRGVMNPLERLAALHPKMGSLLESTAD